MVKKRHKNPHLKNNRRGLMHYLLWQMGCYNDVLPSPMPPEDFTYPNPQKKIDERKPYAMWINHCTFLIHVDGINILTDPIWSERCSPLLFLGPKRRHAPPISIENLPKIDLLFISHDHYDHLDKMSIRALQKKNSAMTLVVPKGLKGWFRKRGFDHIIELDWWKKAEISIYDNQNLHLKITAVPTQHFSGRRLFDKNKALWVGWVVDFERKRKKKKRFYFVGDTGYNGFDFNAIGEHFENMDLSLIPIGTYVPRKFMDPVHIDPIKATRVHQEVNSKLSIGMHWKTFRLSGEGDEQPSFDLYLAMKEANLDPMYFRVIEPGQKINW